MDRGYILSELSGITDDATRLILTRIFDHVVQNVRHGEPDHQTRAGDFRAYFEQSTTGTSTGEFSFAHGIGSAPRLAIPCLDLNKAGSQLVPLEVSRVADSKRVYLKTSAGSTNAAIVLLLE